MPKVVKIQSKGMVTIPKEFREKLKIGENSLLEARLLDNGVMFVRLEYFKPEEVEIYSEDQIQEFLANDKMDSLTASKLKKLLKQ